MSPVYTYSCLNGHRFERYLHLTEFAATQVCLCEAEATLVITPPIMVTAATDICYDSPIDGKPITSWAARQEDLKRHGCQPYDPGMKDDYIRRQNEVERALDQAVEETVAETVTKMPTKKRGQLYSELTEQGVDLAVKRDTVGG